MRSASRFCIWINNLGVWITQILFELRFGVLELIGRSNCRFWCLCAISFHFRLVVGLWPWIYFNYIIRWAKRSNSKNGSSRHHQLRSRMQHRGQVFFLQWRFFSWRVHRVYRIRFVKIWLLSCWTIRSFQKMGLETRFDSVQRVQYVFRKNM